MIWMADDSGRYKLCSQNILHRPLCYCIYNGGAQASSTIHLGNGIHGNGLGPLGTFVFYRGEAEALLSETLMVTAIESSIIYDLG